MQGKLELSLINRIRGWGRDSLTYLMERISLTVYFISFFLIVAVFGCLYFVLTPLEHGIGMGGKALNETTFLDALYFSFVTISSLGYGDIHPVGFSKFLISVEVFIGLSYMGILVAKVTSRRLSYHVQKLFSSDVQKQLDDYSVNFENLGREVLVVMKLIGQAYQITPGEAKVDDKREVLSRFSDTLNRFHAICERLSGYLVTEIEEGSLLNVVPGGSVCKVGESAGKVVFNFGQLLVSLSPEAKAELLDHVSIRRIHEVRLSQAKICNLIQAKTKNKDVAQCFSSYLEICNGIPEGYFTVPHDVVTPEPPDQSLKDSGAPQVGVI